MRGVASGVPLCLEPSIRANEVDGRLAGVRGCCSPSCELESSRSLREEVVGDEWPDVFLDVRPRISAASSEADFFLDFSSSDDRLDDIIVSNVPIARLFLLAACLLRLVVVLMSCSSSDDTACNVGP